MSSDVWGGTDELEYFIVDVFYRDGGSRQSLAVVMKHGGLSTGQMQVMRGIQFERDHVCGAARRRH